MFQKILQLNVIFAEFFISFVKIFTKSKFIDMLYCFIAGYFLKIIYSLIDKKYNFYKKKWPTPKL